MHPSSLIRIGIVLLVVTALLAAPVSSASALSSRSMTLTVYSDGYVLVTQSLSVDPRAASVEVPLIAPIVTDLVATDQNGSPLSYGFSQASGNITVYTLGATGVTVSYDTNNLTSKQGAVWTISFVAKFNVTLVLPQFSTLGSVSGTPYSINETGMSPEMSLRPGAWKVTYGLPLGATISTTSGNTSTSGGGVPGGGLLGLSYFELGEAGAVAAAAVAILFAVRWWRREGIGPVSKDLRPDDVQVLNFIQEKGGRVLEPEIRMRFALPKTSAWRQIKRLERLGYVRVTKIGSQNQIELLRERSASS